MPVTTLLGKGDSNAKLAKSDKAGKGYMTVGLSLAPARTSGYEVCASRSPGCTSECLFECGLGQMKVVQQARIEKTKFFFEDRPAFLALLRKELAFYQRRADKRGLTLACRLNVFSDILWEKVDPDLFREFPRVQFYDYTKHFRRAANYSLKDNTFPANYHLTFSRSEINDIEIKEIIENRWPINVAVVFSTKNLPSEYAGRPVVKGDETDLRFLDDCPTVVGLYAKGKRAKADKTGFVVSLPLI